MVRGFRTATGTRYAGMPPGSPGAARSVMEWPRGGIHAHVASTAGPGVPSTDFAAGRDRLIDA